MTTILLVDDHDDIREMMAQHLRKRGYAVVTASNGLEAVLATAQAAPSLILMDVNMPELDGIEATMQIRAAEVEKRIPVIALTAHALPDDETRAIAAGCDAFHSKPVDFKRLFSQISELLGEKAVNSEGVPS
ncbi:Polar-differentiation response regulator DivK [Rubripirellula amarantea]|uniref:Polar-differentiation response regulator DivK n=1 Tax=Rubripirellula amarantea TaxID=2527999 RepID=A0A5C5WTA3_9BACT|nr:response regulator [Rubripirellula amarantea]TWT53768.1 Polar-differentiation response regulator DivK [Rubripirellula amarantea]